MDDNYHPPHLVLYLKHTYLFCLLLVGLSCSRWEYQDPSDPVDLQPPETYLSLMAADTIYAGLDSLGNPVYAIEDDPSPEIIWDTLSQAFTTITTSKQNLNWWGEDVDGTVIGYYYKWNTDSTWTYTGLESGTFFVPIRSDLDIFEFEVKAVDNDQLIDPSPVRIVLPITNSAPTINFRHLSNPMIADINGDTSFTFPTRTFIWDLYDQDGNETITDIFYALDDTCGSCWTRMEGDLSGITLTQLNEGDHTFYLKCRDIAGAGSRMIQFPDPLRPSEAQVWKVLPAEGDVLIVDDFPLDAQNNALDWYTTIFDTIVGINGYSVWEIGDELPYSSTDVTANLKYFKHVVWFCAYNNTAAANDTYNGAEASLVNFVMGGGNLFINPIDYEDTTFTWFPMDTMMTINRSGLLWSDKDIISPIDSTLNLKVSHLISVRVKGFVPDSLQFAVNKEIYHMDDPVDQWDEWEGNPTVCSLGQFQISPTTYSGKIVIMTLPMHDGYQPKLDGNGSSIKLFHYLFDEEFVE